MKIAQLPEQKGLVNGRQIGLQLGAIAQTLPGPGWK